MRAVLTHDGIHSGASFWKKDFPLIPSGYRVSTSGRSFKYGRSHGETES